MKTINTYVRLTVLLLISCSSLNISANEHIRIASFNIAEFGEGTHPQTRDLPYIATMLTGADIDLVAIQELGVKDEAEIQLNALVAAMNQQVPSGDPQYFSFSTTKTGDERYAVIYRDPVVIEDDILWLDNDKDPDNAGAGGETFFRVPVAIPFHAGEFDFYVVMMHLAWGDLDRRRNEVKAIKDFLIAKDPTEDDWIVLGDMNRYGKYNKGTPNKAFDQLLEGHWSARYRFPLLEAITEPDDMKVYRASTDQQSTTVAKKNNLYDQIIITQGAFAEFGTTTPVLGQDIDIIDFDRDARFATLGHNAIKYQVSDHRPVWIKLQIDLGDDD